MKNSSPPTRKADGEIRATAKRSVIAIGRRTSVSLEDEFWNSLTDIALSRGVSRGVLISEIAADHGDQANLSSAIRLYVLEFYTAQARSISQ